MGGQNEKMPCDLHTVMIQQILEDTRALKADFRAMQVENKQDRKEFWTALNKLRDSITGNGKEGLNVRVDRNSTFRKTMNKLLWILFVPLYGGLVAIIFKIIFNN